MKALVEVVLLKPLRYHGKRYDSGEKVAVSEFEAQRLVEAGAAATQTEKEE